MNREIEDIANFDKKILRALMEEIPTKELLVIPYFQNRDSCFIERCLIPDEQGKRELAFSNALKKYIEGGSKNSAEEALFHLTHNAESKEQVVMNTFRWIITNVGLSVLRDALDKCDLKIVEKDTGNSI